MKLKSFVLTALLPLGLLFSAKAAIAHSIETNYEVNFDHLEIQATFGQGEAFPDAPVTVYSPENPNEPILIGRTDKDGKFSFQPDTSLQGEWEVEIGDAETSHWDAIVVPVNEMGIEQDAISQYESAPDHRHDYVAYSLLLITVVGGAISYQVVKSTNADS
ncbi:MAG: hypothetical protein WBB82_10525 [Limnothrix sp.]